MTVVSAIVGGAGYIGSHVALQLRAAGERVVVVDDLSTGVRSRVPEGELVQIDVSSPESPGALARVLSRESVSTVYHFAAEKSVERANENPTRAYRLNIDGMRHVLEACEATDIGRVVFSSTAAIYGETDETPVSESVAPLPINAYGRSKLAAEWLLSAYTTAHPETRAGILRYFNVAGCASSYLAETRGTNLIPNALRALASGHSPVVYGTDYPTRDGTCVRDYIHVEDVAAAHLAVARVLDETQRSVTTVNVGSGEGYTVLEVLQMAREISNTTLPIEFADRREGDPAVVIADTTQIMSTSTWRPRRTLRDMVTSTWTAITDQQAMAKASTD